MVAAYVQELSELMERALPVRRSRVRLEVKHFFSGAAVYANSKICITLTPKGLAMKLPVEDRNELLDGQGAKPLRYFPQGPVKKEYVVLPPRIANDSKALRRWVTQSIEYAVSSSK